MRLKILYRLSIIKVWISVIVKFTINLGKTDDPNKFDPKYLYGILGQQHILEIIKRLLQIYIPTEQQGEGHLISISGVLKFDEELNEIKKTVFVCFNEILDYMKTYPQISDSPQDNLFYGFIESLAAKFALDHIFRFCKSKASEIEMLFSVRKLLWIFNEMIE